MRDFREIKVWEKAHALTLRAYEVTRSFPREELYGSTSQIRRAAAASIGANIAEGCVKNTDPDFARYLQTALGSASELEYHLLLAKDLKLLDSARYGELDEDAKEVKKMLTAFIAKLRSRAAGA